MWFTVESEGSGLSVRAGVSLSVVYRRVGGFGPECPVIRPEFGKQSGPISNKITVPETSLSTTGIMSL